MIISGRRMSGRLFIAALLMLMFLCLSTAEGQTGSRHAAVRSAMEKGDYPAAERSLREMARISPREFALNNYDYLLARLLDQRGARDEAATWFRRVLDRKSILAGYALWHLAEIARGQGGGAEEQRLLRAMIERYPDHLLIERAAERLGDSCFRDRRYDEAIQALRSLNGPRRDALARIGEAQLELKQVDSARASFNAVLLSNQMDDPSLRAIRGLDRLDESAAVPEEDRLRRARIYQFNRFFASARRHWSAIIRDYPNSANRSEALFQLGRGYFLEDKFAEAAKWYSQVAQEFPKTEDGELGFYYVGHCHQYRDQTDQAIARYEEFLRSYPASKYVGYAYLNAIDTLRSAGRNAEALKWSRRAESELKEPFFTVTGLFNQVRIHLSQGKYDDALEALGRLRSRNLNVRGLSATTNPSEVDFLRAYCFEQMGRFNEAIAEYLKLEESRNGAEGYYGRRSSERLVGLGANPRASALVAAQRDRFLTQARSSAARKQHQAARYAADQALRFKLSETLRAEMLRILRTSYGALRGYSLPALNVASIARQKAMITGDQAPTGTDHQTLASELLFLGLDDEGSLELVETKPSVQTLASVCAGGNCANRTLRYSEPILNGLPADYRPELLPRQWAEIFYPMPYRGLLDQLAVPRGVDPRFLLSISRQESGYDPRALSPAAARGMLQFIAPTANRFASKLHVNDFEQSDLYRPEIAILFGSEYMKELFDEFDSPQAVAASYNGSEDSVRRWRARAGSRDVDRLVIEIAKRETKDYVFKVGNYFHAYRVIYPSVDKQRRSPR